MIIYIALLFITFFCSVIENKILRKQKYYIFNICLLILWLVSAFRSYTVGTDTLNYLYNYQHLHLNEVRGVEYGWYVINWICKNVFYSYRALLIIVSFLTLYYLGKAIRRISSNWCLSLFLYISFYFYFQTFNISRQMLAASLVLYALTFVPEKKICKYFSLILFAASIHSSAIVALPLFFLPDFKIPKIIGVGCIALSFIFSSKIAPYILPLFADFEEYSRYMYSELQDESYISTNLIFHSLVAIFLLFFNKKNNYLFLITFVGVIVVNSLSIIDVIGRVGIYMKLAIVLVFPQTLIVFNSKLIGEMSKYCILLLLSVSCLVMLLANTEGVYPYSFL